MWKEQKRDRYVFKKKYKFLQSESKQAKKHRDKQVVFSMYLITSGLTMGYLIPFNLTLNRHFKFDSRAYFQ